MLGFLSWNFYVTAIVVCALFRLVYWTTQRHNKKRLASLFVLTAFATSGVAAVALPHINAAYLRTAGVHRTAVIERVTPFHVFNLGRATQLGENIRYDLRVEENDGSSWKSYVQRNVGLLGPYLLNGARAVPGDRVMLAYVEGNKANVTLVHETSDAVWQAAARNIETQWSIMPPEDNWVSHKMHRDQIDAFLEEYEARADAETVTRFLAMREQLTLLPPDGQSGTPNWP
ncbi:hypothetical protein AAIB41_11595 [Brucella sp. BE17]|uniref:hypothetical protein n=1 Tax=Brucella sp. BE17 TaxID=3142977 RepID=UPI0031BB07A8